MFIYISCITNYDISWTLQSVVNVNLTSTKLRLFWNIDKVHIYNNIMKSLISYPQMYVFITITGSMPLLVDY